MLIIDLYHLLLIIIFKEELDTIHEKLNTQIKRINQEIELLQQELDSLPPGKLIVTKYQTRFKWYVKNDRKLTYIPKSDREYAEALAKKKYLTLKLNDLMNERNAIQFYLQPDPHSESTSQANQANQLLSDPRYKHLLSPYFQVTDHELSAWVASPVEHNPKYPEQLSHNSISGNIVRSKSEAIIDMALYMNQIPFRYEAQLVLSEIPLYPDFTILHPRTKKIFYWEHFGMMDVEKYAKSACTKISLYVSNGILPSIQLITTFETKDYPLSSDLVEEIIHRYFL